MNIFAQTANKLLSSFQLLLQTKLLACPGRFHLCVPCLLVPAHYLAMDVVVEPASPPPESGRSSPSPTASPEFEFWMVGRNPGSFPSPALLTADELFSDGIVLPLHTLQPPFPNADQHEDAEEEEDAEDDVKESSEAAIEGEFAAQPLAESCTLPAPDLPAVTFKWKDIFKAAGEHKDRSSKKAERRVSSVSGNSELININIWPFSRSRSAGHSAAAGAGAVGKAKPSNPGASNASNTSAVAAASAPAAPAAGRKVSSAPCSRSNSRGETSGPAALPTVAIAVAAEKAAATSMLRRWVPGGQGRAGLGASGIRLGRASPVWQLRRNKLQQQQAAAELKQKDGAKTNNKESVPVPDDDVATSQPDATAAEEEDKEDAPAPASVATSVSAATAPCRNNAACSEADGEECNPPHGLFGLRRTFFSKKVY
uniref:Uncharacterized protein n=1 Tax=Avena sativa TaxID=4498 RepID=A0ACD5WNI4_AVESA